MAWMKPPAGSAQRAARCGTERVGRRAVVRAGVGVEIRIAGHVLTLAVDEQLVDHQPGGRLGLEDAVPVRLPLQIQLQAAAEHHGFAGRRRVDVVPESSRSDDDRLGQVVRAGVEQHGLGVSSFVLPAGQRRRSAAADPPCPNWHRRLSG